MHIRSGKEAQWFEITGIGKRNKRVSVIIFADPHNVKYFLEFPIQFGIRRVRFTDRTSIWIEQIGTQEDIKKFLGKTENLDLENIKE